MTTLVDNLEFYRSAREAQEIDQANGVLRYDDPHHWRRLDLGELVALADVETAWRCHGFAAGGYLTVLSGRGGEGKSMFTLGLGSAVIAGEPLAGIKCTQGTVAIFDAENGPKLIGRRLKSAQLLQHTGLAIYDADGLDLARDAGWMEQQLQGVGLAVFDSLRTLAPGAKENESDDMAPRMIALRQLARRTGTAVILVHHRGKDGEKDFRGSEVIRDLTDLMFVLERDPKDPEKHWRRALRCVKCRIDEEPAPRSLGIRINDGHLHFTEAAPFAQEPRAPKRAEWATRILQELEAGPSRRSQIAKRFDLEPSNQTFRRAFDDLAQDGHITQNGDLWSLVKPPVTSDDNDNQEQVVRLSPPFKGANP